MNRIKKALKSKQKLRVIFEGASGSGKTVAALILAKSLGTAVVIDTENGSSNLYADHPLLKGYEFDVLELSEPYSPDEYIKAIRECEDAGYDSIIIDSITHEWNGKGGVCEIANKLGGYPKGWQKATPMHEAFVYALLHSKCHIICTCRSKQAYAMDEVTKKVTKQGLEPQQRDGLDYEMTTCFVLNQNHMAESNKDRTSMFDGKPMMVDEKVGQMYLDWLNSGAEPTPVTNPSTNTGSSIAKSKFAQSMDDLGKQVGDEIYTEFLSSKNITDLELVPEADRGKIWKELKTYLK